MKAYKCDRCGKFYDEDETDKSDIFVVDRISYKRKDLCKECNALFNEWWQDGEYIKELTEKWKKKEGDSND